VNLSAGPEGLVDLHHDPVEQVCVDALRQSVASESGLKSIDKQIILRLVILRF
jgi:hypothetical protein